MSARAAPRTRASRAAAAAATRSRLPCAHNARPLQVDVKACGSVHKGMPHKYYHGKTGIVYNVTARAVRTERGVRRSARAGASALPRAATAALPRARPATRPLAGRR